MVKCKICGKEMKRMTTAHVKTHGLSSIEEYESHQVEEFQELGVEVTIPEMEEADSVQETEEIVLSYEDRMKMIKDKEIDPYRPLQDFLNKYSVTEDEIIGMIHKYKIGRELNVKEQIARNEEIGKRNAEKYKDSKYVEAHDVNTAETLVNFYGFTCTEVRSKPTKTWVLIKK